MSNPRKEDTSPATKADIADLREATQADIAELRDATQAGVEALRREIRAEGKETRRHFDVVAEKMLHDFRGAFGDRTAQHGDMLQSYGRRLDTIETHLGLVV